MNALIKRSHLNMFLQVGQAQFRAHFRKQLSNFQAQIENRVAYEKMCIVNYADDQHSKAVPNFSKAQKTVPVNFSRRIPLIFFVKPSAEKNFCFRPSSAQFHISIFWRFDISRSKYDPGPTMDIKREKNWKLLSLCCHISQLRYAQSRDRSACNLLP